MFRMVISAAILAFSTGAFADKVSGVQLPDGASKVAERRYKTSKSYEDTLKYFKTAYPLEKYPRRAIINQAGVRAIHIPNPSKREWEGINIYEANGEVRIFILTAPEPQKKKGK